VVDCTSGTPEAAKSGRLTEIKSTTIKLTYTSRNYSRVNRLNFMGGERAKATKQG
jgi:hypothetical protein